MDGAWIEGLGWLLPPPRDFRAQAKAFRPGDGGAPLAALAGFALDIDALTTLDRAVRRAAEAPDFDAAPLSPVRLALLGESTTDYAAPAIRASAPRHGLFVTIHAPDYGQAMREAMDPSSPLRAFRPDVALVAHNHRSLGLDAPRFDPDAAAEAVDAAVARVTALLDALAAGPAPTVVVQTVPTPPEPWCGSLDRAAPGSVAAQIAAFNARLVALAAERAATVLDVAALADLVGRARWFDHAQWHRAKLPFALSLTPLYAEHVARILGALRGKARKCLVLDLDNTCWGGVIGDDGLEGIRIGQGSADGEAFLAVQAYALSLKARGIVLAVCSKNEDDAARKPFREHPDMLLREDDIAVFVANWNDKATNIRAIAKALNIGVDALAFLDDNPAERARVRQMLPEVAVPELPDDAAFYPAALAHAGYFEAVALTADDARRAEQYRENARRAVAMEAVGDYDAYLASLDMACDLRPFDAVGRARIAQLINKSNQFNLTTRRYTEAQVAAMGEDPALFTLQIRLSDAFGDNGMISVVVFRIGAREWVCDTWLMSCRVLGRRVEEAALATVAAAARAAGAERLVGDYLPSAKNRMVEGHFAKLGFRAIGAPPDAPDGQRWALDLADYAPPELPMRIESAFDARPALVGALAR